LLLPRQAGRDQGVVEVGLEVAVEGEVRRGDDRSPRGRLAGNQARQGEEDSAGEREEGAERSSHWPILPKAATADRSVPGGAFSRRRLGDSQSEQREPLRSLAARALQLELARAQGHVAVEEGRGVRRRRRRADGQVVDQAQEGQATE